LRIEKKTEKELKKAVKKREDRDITI